MMVEQVGSRLKQVSALLTLLLATLFVTPASANGSDVGRSAAQALVEMDVAFGAASLQERQGARSAAQQSDHEPDTAGAAVLPSVSAAVHLSGTSPTARPYADPLPPNRPLSYHARAPPQVVI